MTKSIIDIRHENAVKYPHIAISRGGQLPALVPFPCLLFSLTRRYRCPSLDGTTGGGSVDTAQLTSTDDGSTLVSVETEEREERIRKVLRVVVAGCSIETDKSHHALRHRPPLGLDGSLVKSMLFCDCSVTLTHVYTMPRFTPEGCRLRKCFSTS